MSFQPADSLTLALFLVLGGLIMGLTIWAFAKTRMGRGFTATYLALTLVTSILAASGLMRAHTFPLLPVFISVVILLAVFFARSPAGKEIARGRSFAALVGFQSFRLPLELILHEWAGQKVIPETMTWTGQNWDIITGVLAVVLAPLANRSRYAAWIFQIVGSLLLLNVIRVVVRSLPLGLPFSWKLEIPLQLPFEFPYVLVLPLLVWPAMLGHMILMRKLWGSRS